MQHAAKGLAAALGWGGGIQNSFVQLITLDRSKLQELSRIVAKVVKEAIAYFARCNDTFYLQCRSDQALTSIEDLPSSEIAFQIQCFLYTGIGDGVTFKPCTSSRNAEEIEADTSSGSKEDGADVNYGDDEDDDNDAITANHSVDYIFGDEDKENEGNDDLEQEICSEVEDNDIAPSKYSAYGIGDPLRGANIPNG